MLGSGDIPTVNFEYWISTTNPLKTSQPFPILNQIKYTEPTGDDDSRYVQLENNHIHDSRPTKKHHIPVTQFQGYKSYYHRNEILRSVPSWSIKRHRTHKNNFNSYTHAQKDISSSTVKNILNTSMSSSSGEQNRADKTGFVTSYETRNKKYSPDVHQLDKNTGYSHPNTGLKPPRSYNVYDFRQETNLTAQKHQRKFQSYQRSDDRYGRPSTTLALARDNYHQKDSIVTWQPSLLLSSRPESSVKPKSGRRRQKSIKNAKSKFLLFLFPFMAFSHCTSLVWVFNFLNTLSLYNLCSVSSAYNV